MRRLLPTFPAFLMILALAAGAIVYRDEVRVAATQIYARALPCSSPTTYRIGTVDERFNLTRAQYLSTIQAAEAIWEKGSKRDLFAYNSENGSVVINLVYDYRQQAIDRLKKIGLTIDDTQSSYDRLKTKYDAMKASYDHKRATLEAHIADFKRAQDSYNTEVQSWNARGGAPTNVYDELQQKKEDLNAQRAQIEAEQSVFNADVDTINALATALNRLVSVLHLEAAKYNAIGRETGGEFEEGVYESRLGVQKIDIFEFGDRAELTRVLAHELGHALGLDHVEDKDAIMYRLNQSSNDRMRPADLNELERICGVRS